MKKIRCESLEYLCGRMDPIDVAKMAFQFSDQSIKELRELGIEIDFFETIILNDKEYHRKDLFKDD